jgi:two-component system, OmpR family, copper resistance phosphate regulon response regulator CusR
VKLELKKKILVVEDDEQAALIAEKVLEKHFSVTTVPNGYVALNAVELIRFDAVLMDINLGDYRMDGLNTMRKIKAGTKNKRLKIFAITAFSDIRDWYINQGFDDLIIKPIDDEKAAQIINSKINTYVTGRSLFSKPTAA